METTPHYRHRCVGCGVGLTDELAYRHADGVYYPHCHGGRNGEPGAGRVWADAGLPQE